MFIRRGLNRGGEARITTANNGVHLCNRRLDCGFNANHWRVVGSASTQHHRDNSKSLLRQKERKKNI